MKDTWRFDGEELTNLKEVLDSGEVGGMTGSANQRFESAFAKVVGANYAVTFNSGTSTLHAALHALGVGRGDEVIIPVLTVIANLHVILAQSAIPVFADIDIDTFNIDPTDVLKKITPKTKAIIIVPLYGAPCDYDSFIEISKTTGVPIINDAAQAPLAKYNHRQIASLFDITSFSFDATKHMSTGDGGMITTLSEETAVRIRKFGCLGYKALSAGDGRIRMQKDIFQSPEYSRHDDIGLNYRMSEFQAAVGLAQVKKLKYFVNLRQSIADEYSKLIDGCNFLIPQQHFEKVRVDGSHAYWTFVCRLDSETVLWHDFRRKFIEFGGSGIYAAWKLIYQEDVFTSGAWKKRDPELYANYKPSVCSVAEKVQPQLMQFPLNHSSLEDAKGCIDALKHTIEYFS